LNTYYQWDSHTARWAWCQESGHVLGLDHRGTSGTTADDPNSCMSYHPSAPTHPDDHDINQLACQTVEPGQRTPQPNCTSSSSGSSDSSGCIAGLICLNSDGTYSYTQASSAAGPPRQDEAGFL